MTEDGQFPKPGSFRSAPMSHERMKSIKQRLGGMEIGKSNNDLEPTQSQNLIQMYKVFQEAVNPVTDIVYYPSSSVDTSPSFAFPSSKVLYIDIDGKAVEALKKGGFEAHKASALEHNPGEVDILIMLNPQIDPDFPSGFVRDGGYVIANDYHGTATKLSKLGNFKPTGLLRRSEDGIIYDTEDPEAYLKTVETDEEWKKAPFSFGLESFKDAREVAMAVMGSDEDVISGYKKVLALSKTRSMENGDMDERTDQSQPFILLYGGTSYILSTELPKKKGTVDDLLVFRKVETNPNF